MTCFTLPQGEHDVACGKMRSDSYYQYNKHDLLNIYSIYERPVVHFWLVPLFSLKKKSLFFIVSYLMTLCRWSKPKDNQKTASVAWW